MSCSTPVRARARYARPGGADIGECFATAARIGKTDLDRWYRECLATTERTEACVSDCDPYDLFDAAAARIPGVLRGGAGWPVPR